jgi:hypothetical protein
MIRALYDFLYGSKTVEFKSAFGLEESIERLRAATKRSVFSALAQPAAVGPVKASQIRLQRVIPMVGNSFKPFFFGRFDARSDAVYLTGRFTLLPLVKAFMTLWLGMAIAFGVTSAFKEAARVDDHPALAVLAMPVFGIALVALGKWFARNDISWLSHVIQTALGTVEASISPPSHVAVTDTRTPLVLRVVAGVLAFMGLMNLTNLYEHWIPPGSIGSQLNEPTFQTAMVTLGVTMLGLAIGVYQRRLLAWRFGLGFLGAIALMSIVQVGLFAPLVGPPLIKMIMCVAAVAVYALWIRWWFAQRVHFIADDMDGPRIARD